VTLRSCEMGFH